MKFTEKYKINIHDEGFNGVVTPTGYLRYMQDCANCHMEADGPSYRELFDKGLAFILSRMKVVFHEPLRGHDIVEGSTWACEGKGVSFPRCYELKRDGVLCAEGKSIWALCDVNSHRLCRVDFAGLTYRTDDELDIALPRMIKPITELEKVGDKTVVFADVDINKHMNNTVYADMFWNYVPELDKLLPLTFDIFYKSEAKLGTKLEIFRAKSENGYFFRSVGEDGRVNAEAEFTVKNIGE